MNFTFTALIFIKTYGCQFIDCTVHPLIISYNSGNLQLYNCKKIVVISRSECIIFFDGNLFWNSRNIVHNNIFIIINSNIKFKYFIYRKSPTYTFPFGHNPVFIIIIIIYIIIM